MAGNIPVWQKIVLAGVLSGVFAHSAHALTIAPGNPAAVPAQAKLRKDTVVGAIAAPQGIFNPYLIQNGWDGNVTEVIFGRLIGRDISGKPIPEQAESWQISKDGLQYTIKLRKGLKFSDGSPFTADDVAFTLTFLHDPSYDGGSDIALAKIKGGAEYKAGKADKISGIEVLNPQTLRVTVLEPGATTLTTLGGPILSRAYYGKAYSQGKIDGVRQQSSKPLGAGPYRYEKFVPGQEVRFSANPHFYAGKPAVQNFIYRVTGDATKLQLFQTGETDLEGFAINNDNIAQLKSLGFAKLHIYDSSDYSLIEFNHRKSWAQDVRVRQALTYGLDRKKLVDVVYQGHGQVATVPISPSSWAHDTRGVNPYAFNPAKARALLEQAGWKLGADGIREKNGQKLTISLLATKSLFNDALIPIAKESWRQIGVDLRPELSDFNALLAKRKAGNYDLATFRTPGLDDPHDGVSRYLSANTEDGSGYKNAEVDRLIQAGNATLDTSKRKQVYNKLYQTLGNDVPLILLATRKLLYVNSSRVANYQPDVYNGIFSSLPKLKIVAN